MPNPIIVSLCLAGLAALSSCKSGAGPNAAVPERTRAAHLTTELRDEMSPEDVYQRFKDGHARFISGNLQYRKLMTEVTEGSIGQSPHAIVLSCIDSRVPVETIFDKRIGDIFSTRLAGNVINEDVLGGMEFATQLAGAKLVLVMGHTKCGAVKGAAAHVEHGNLTALVSKIKPSLATVQASWKGAPDPNDYAFVDAVAAEHVRQTIAEIRAKSPELERMEKQGKIKIVGAMYSVTDGRVTFYD